MQQIIHRYGLALFQLVTNDSILKKIDEDFESMNQLFIEQPCIFKFLTSKATKIKDTTLALTIITAQLNTHELIVRFLNILLVNHRINLLLKIIERFNDLVNEHKNLLKVHVTSAHTLDLQAKNQLEQQLAEKFDQQLVYTYHVDFQLLGGFIITVKSMTLDSSLSNKLVQLQRYLSKS